MTVRTVHPRQAPRGSTADRRALRLGRSSVVAALTLVLAAVLVLAVTGQPTAARWTAVGAVGLFVLWTLVGMIRDVLHGHVGLDILAVVAMVATLAVDEYVAAIIVALMLSGGEALEEVAARRAKRDLSALLDRSPRVAHRLASDDRGDATGVQDVGVDAVAVGDLLLVRPAEIVPVDGILVTGSASFDESSLTGESMPVHRSAGEEVPSGAINGTQAATIRALRPASASQYQQIVALVAEAQDSKAPVVRLADRFAVPFTAVALILGITAWALAGDPRRFAEVLVLATPCPLLIAAPVAFLAGLSRAARSGVIVKGGAIVERLARVRSAAFDKTGTITIGTAQVVDVIPAAGQDADELLGLAAAAEQYSTHVFAEGIRRAAAARGLPLGAASSASEGATNGVVAVIDGREVVVGKGSFVSSVASPVEPVSVQPGQAVAYVAVDGRFAGALLLADDARPEAADVIGWLRRHGVERIAMLTGDAGPTAESIARRVGIDEVHSALRPAEKVQLAAEMQPRPILMVGDGINDAPVLAAADVGIAMGAHGGTAAGDAADVVVLVDTLTGVVDAVAVGRHTVAVALTAIWIGIGLSVALMLVAMTGVIPAVAGALIQEAVDVATILYALRALGPGRTERAEAARVVTR